MWRAVAWRPHDQHLKPPSPCESEENRLELLRQVNEIRGVAFGPEVISGQLSIQLSVPAQNPATLEALKQVITWVEQEAGETPQLIASA